jgi:hypothetical protein
VWAILALVSAAVVARVTLFPASGWDRGTLQACLLCGAFGLADFVANVMLFVPLAVSLRGSGVGPRVTVVLLGALSAGIEVAQLRIPGRDSTLGDVVANTTGAALGVALAWWWPRRRRTWRAAGMAAAGALAVIVGGGALLRPYFPPTRYFGMWTPVLDQFEPYRGRVLDARIGGLPLRDWEFPDSRAVRAAFERGDTLVVRGIAGPPTPGLAPFFSVADDRRRTVFLLGVDGRDFVLDATATASALRLHQPDLRWRRALAGAAPGDTLTLEVWRETPGYVVRLGGAERRLAYTAGDVWGLIAALPSRLATMRAAVAPLFLAFLGLPLGVLLPRRRAAVVLVVSVLVAAFGLPLLVALAPTPPLQLAALAAGTTLGVLIPQEW